MCPICIGSALYLLSGAGSAGGITALALRSKRRGRNAEFPGNSDGRPEGDAHGDNMGEVRMTGVLDNRAKQ